MHLTRFSDIGLRVMLYLAKAGDERPPVTVAEIAGQFRVPQNHLVKVVAHLSRTGWVHSQRGRNGGLRLQADPDRLRMGVVLKALEGDKELLDCDNMDCALSDDCRLRSVLRVGLRAFYDALDEYSLTDMTRGQTGEQIIQMHGMFLSQVH